MKRWLSDIISIIKDEYKFIVILILLYCIFQIPLNYYIVVGGGTSDVSSRIEVEGKKESKGSFHISYVTELQGTILTYGLSYLIPTWERENANLYKYTEEESIEDIEFRNNLDLKTANANATYWAYTKAKKEIKEKSSKIYVITILEDFETPLKVGDEILSIDEKHFDTPKEYRDYIQGQKENQEITIKVLRNKKEKEVKSKIISYKNQLFIGVGLQLVKEYETNPKVAIKFKKSESGPSGGLITTLEIYNELTKKDLTNGLKIAGTGTIEQDGTIGEIGGVEHKLLGASSAKCDIFLVPSGQNYQDAVKYKIDKKLKIEIIEVATIDEAIEKLEALS